VHLKFYGTLLLLWRLRSFLTQVKFHLISPKISNLAYEWLIGLRYTRASRGVGRRNGFISFISGLSVAGIALGVAALIIVLSVMNGFQKEVRDRMLSVLSHIEVSAIREPLLDWRPVVAQAKKNERVLDGAPYVAGQAMLSYEDIVRGVLVRGIDPAEEGKVSDFVKTLVKGKLTDLVPGEFGIIIGKSLSNQLGLGVGDKMALIAPQGTLTPAGFLSQGTMNMTHLCCSRTLLMRANCSGSMGLPVYD
jgi:lipoprotein-releasing system permease protein